jgi:thiol-disulfide isomerase/thioredoxin
MRHFPRLLIAVLAPVHLWAQGTESPASILRSALRATEKIDTIEYEVRRESKGPDGALHPAWSTIVAARSPFGFQARFRDEDSGARDMAVLDGEVTRYSADGVSGEIPRTFFAAGQVVPNRAAVDVATTWHVLLDRDFITTAIDSGSIVYAGKDDIAGDLCRIVLYVRAGEDSGSNVDWYWISEKTGMPRAVQRVTLRRGTTRLVDRAVISIVRTNFRIPPDLFRYRPSAADSTPAATSTRVASPRNLRGTRLPDLEVKDADYKSLKLSDLIGVPRLVTFWAPWCFACIEEMEALAKLEPAYRGKLRVLAIAVQDSRLNVLSWVKEHPQFDFTFATDPELPETTSRLVTYFGAVAIPVSVLVSADGTVMDSWFGFRTAEELEKKLSHLLQPSEK